MELATLEGVPDIKAKIEAARSRVHGFESALAERAVFLLDKLSRSVIHPFAMADVATDLTASNFTDLDERAFRNSHDGVFLFSRARLWAGTSPSAGAASAPLSQYSLMVGDSEGHHQIMRDPTFSPVLFAQDTSTWVLDRPYVLDRGASMLVRVLEEAGGGISDVALSMLGEVVLGDMTAAEVEEAIMLGVYPASGRQSSVWDHALVFAKLFGDRPARLKGEADDLLHDLRSRVAGLRLRLASAYPVLWSMEGSNANLDASSINRLARDDFRNDQGGPFCINEVRIFTRAALAATAAGAVFQNVDMKVESVSERISLMRDEIMLPVLVNLETNSWRFDHPHVMRQTGSLQVDLRETAGAATTDVHVAFVGEVLQDATVEDVRAATALGLYPTAARYYE